MTIDIQNLVSKFKVHRVVIISVVISLLIGFYAGMQYKAYQIRRAFSDAATEIGKAFNKGFTDFAKEDSAAPAPKDTPTQNILVNKLNDRVLVELVGKDFKTSDYQSYNIFRIKLSNKTDRDIRGIKGTITFLDIFENVIKTASVSYDEGLRIGQTKEWDGSLYYNQFMDDDKKLRNTDFENLKYRWDTETIVYQDGTKEAK